MSDSAALRKRIEELEAEIKTLKSCSNDKLARPKIENMSSEVVDSNPYRYVSSLCLSFIQVLILFCIDFIFQAYSES